MSFQRKLRALNYPSQLTADDCTSLTSPAFRTLVVWLEFTKIRFYQQAQREALKDIQSTNWIALLLQYLNDISCPRTYSAEMTQEQIAILLDWMLNQAIGAEYSDHAGEYNSVSKMYAAIEAQKQQQQRLHPGVDGAESTSTANGQLLFDCTSSATRAEFESSVSELASLFRIPFDRAQMTQIVRVIRKRVEESSVAAAAAAGNMPSAAQSASAIAASSSAAAAAASSSKPASSAAATSTAQSKAKRYQHTVDTIPLPTTRDDVFKMLDTLELGFSGTGDALVDHAAQVFRLLFLHDLRSTQNLSNELMMLAQEYTSDPKTDAKLGKVGS